MSDAKSETPEERAYRAMFEFLVAYFERGNRASDDIAILLSAMNFSKDPTQSYDPAAWHDWLAAWEKTAK